MLKKITFVCCIEKSISFFLKCCVLFLVNFSGMVEDWGCMHVCVLGLLTREGGT